ncbi:MAG: O-antigen ligase family protein [Pseudomonadota bacterium]|nr:O-antigen ligase family protein [Pseudomonadota bacterium]
MNHVSTYKAKFSTLSGILIVASFAALPVSTTLTDILLLLSIISMIASGNISEKINAIIHNHIALLFLAFFALFLLGTLYSTAPSHDITKMLLKNTKLLYGALLIPLFFEEKWRQYALNILIIVMSIIMLLSYLKIAGWLTISVRYEDSAVFKDHIQMNFLMAFLVYLLLGKCFERSSVSVTLFWAALLLLAAVNTLYFSEGRTGYVVFAVLILLFGWQRFSFKGFFIALLSIGLLVSGVWLSASHSQNRVVQVVTETKQYQQGNAQTSTGLRLSFYKNAVRLIAQHPIIGSGTGSVTTQYQKIETNSALQTSNVHNEYLNIAIQLGIIGLSFMLYFFIMIFIKSYTLGQRYRELAQATVVAIAVGCLANSWLMDTLEGHFFAMMLALCFSPLHRHPQQETHSRAHLSNTAKNVT